MRKNIIRVLFFLFVFYSSISLILSSCKKEDMDTDSTSATDNALCEGEFSRIFPQVNGIAVGDSGVQKGIYISIPVGGGCPEPWIDPTDTMDGFPVTLWLYFGKDDNGDGYYEISCTGNDGKKRQGEIKAVFSAPWNNVNASVTMDLINYYVNSIKYEGKITVTRGNGTFSQTVVNGKCSSSGWSIQWNSSRTITTLLGDSANVFDDVCLISGNANGVDRNGKTFDVLIDPSSPIRREIGCPYIVSGKQTLKPEGKKDRVIDFGDGTCDNKATLIIDGNKFEFTLK